MCLRADLSLMSDSQLYPLFRRFPKIFLRLPVFDDGNLLSLAVFTTLRPKNRGGTFETRSRSLQSRDRKIFVDSQTTFCVRDKPLKRVRQQPPNSNETCAQIVCYAMCWKSLVAFPLSIVSFANLSFFNSCDAIITDSFLTIQTDKASLSRIVQMQFNLLSFPTLNRIDAYFNQ